MNALAHCAEALYVSGRSPAGDAAALAGAPLIAAALPRVLSTLHDRDARSELLRGAAHAGEALGLAGLGLGHAMAQALGGAYGLPHGAMNALCLTPALEFTRPLAPEAVARFGEAVGGDPVERTRSWRVSEGSNACATSSFPRMICRLSLAPRRPARVTRQIRVRPHRRRSNTFS